MRGRAREALRFLRSCTSSAYFEFYDEHTEFLKEHPNATSKQRKRWLRFIERVGVECACWPNLFYDTRMCMSWVRHNHASRRGRREQDNLEEVLAGGRSSRAQRDVIQNLEADSGLEPPEEDEVVTSTKMQYQALVMSPLIGYDSYEILHYAFDLNLWTSIGAKRSLKCGERVTMRILMKNHSFSQFYWQSNKLALIDIVRQRGYPKIFWTSSPYEYCVGALVVLRGCISCCFRWNI